MYSRGFLESGRKGVAETEALRLVYQPADDAGDQAPGLLRRQERSERSIPGRTDLGVPEGAI